jgi:hypothetical protein
VENDVGKPRQAFQGNLAIEVGKDRPGTGITPDGTLRWIAQQGINLVMTE